MRSHLADVLSRTKFCFAATALISFGIYAAAQPAKGPAAAPPKAANAKPIVLEARFNDDGVLKVTPRDEHLEFVTPYGKLSIPVSDIQRLEVGSRLPDGDAKKIQAAIANLGNSEFRVREAASAALLGFKEKAYALVEEAAKSPEAETARRARELLDRIKESVPAEKLATRPHDIIHTENSTISGRLTADSLKVLTTQFGEQQVRITDLRELRLPNLVAAEPADVIGDPGTMMQYLQQVGRTFHIRVTGGVPGVPGGQMIIQGGVAIRAGGGGSVWGTDMYTADSSIALAAVHAGALKSGQTGVVKVTVLGPQIAFQGSMRNGVGSMDWGQHPGAFKFGK